MEGVSFHIDVQGLQAVLTRLGKASALDKRELMDGLGRLGEEQTRKRIEIEKTSPEGKAWKPTIDGRGALFVTGTHLARSIDYAASENEARWGSGWIGARVHQFGAVITPVNAKALRFDLGGKTVFAKKVTIPARPYVGLSATNAREMEETAARFLDLALQ